MTESATTRSSWIELFRSGLGLYTVILNLGIALHAIDVFVIATVMPAVVHDIGGARFYAWATMLYMVASILGAAAGAPLKTRVGTRRGYAIAGLGFLVGTLVCGAAPTMAVLLAGRLLQGLGGGAIVAQSMALVRELYPPHIRTRVLATVSGVWGIAALIGPLFGGVFAELGWWRGAFLAAAPIIVAFLALSWRYLPTGWPDTVAARFPIRRLGLLTAGIMAVGVSSLLTVLAAKLGLLALAAVLVWLTFRIDARGADHLFPRAALSLRSPIGCGYWMFFLISITHSMVGIFLPLAMQVVRGVSPLVAGYFPAILALAWTGATFAASGLHGTAEMRAIIIGPAVAVIGMIGLAMSITAGPIICIAVAVAVIGAGIGLCNLHLAASTMRLAETGEEAVTAASIPTVRNLGIAFGAALAGLVANASGLGSSLSSASVAAAASSVDALNIASPTLVFLLALRLYALRRRAGSA